MPKLYACPEPGCGQFIKWKDRYGHRDMHMQQAINRFYSENAQVILESEIIPEPIKKQVREVKRYDLPDSIPDFVKEIL